MEEIINEIREYSEFACLLNDCDFEKLDFPNKVLKCCETGLFKILVPDLEENNKTSIHTQNNYPEQEIMKSNYKGKFYSLIEVPYDESIKTHILNVGVHNSQFFDENQKDFYFSSHYTSTCKHYDITPNQDFLQEITECFFDAFSSNYSHLNKDFNIDYNFTDDKNKPKFLKKKIKKLSQNEFKNLKWENRDQTFFIDYPDGLAWLLQDCHLFILNFLCSNYYYPEIIEEDKVMVYKKEISSYVLMKRCSYLLEKLNNNVLEKDNLNVEIHDSNKKTKQFSLLQIAIAFEELGFYEIIQKQGIESPLNFIATLVGKNGSSYRAARSKAAQVGKTKNTFTNNENQAIKDIYQIMNKELK